jgi:hypothetical protein
MALLDSSRVPVGIALIVVGSLLFLPAIFPGTSQLFIYALAPAALLLALGTWLVGTSEDGATV